jgi:integrase
MTPGRPSTDRSPAATVREARPPKLLDRVRHAIRTLHYSPRTERAYVYWIRRFIFHHGVRHPAEMGAEEVRAFLSHLAVNEGVSASTQNQALNALVFLYGRVLGREVGLLDGVDRAKRPKRLPVVLTRSEVRTVLDGMEGVPLLVCQLLYGAGLRLLECLSLRVKDIDFERYEILVRDGKGAKDRVTVLPASCRDGLLRHLERARRLHGEDLQRGLGRAPLPFALAQKYLSADANGAGSTSFPRLPTSPTASRASGTGTTCMRPWFRRPWPRRCGRPASPNPRHPTACAPSPLISSMAATISGRSRNCSATRTSAQP